MRVRIIREFSYLCESIPLRSLVYITRILDVSVFQHSKWQCALLLHSSSFFFMMRRGLGPHCLHLSVWFSKELSASHFCHTELSQSLDSSLVQSNTAGIVLLCMATALKMASQSSFDWSSCALHAILCYELHVSWVPCPCYLKIPVFLHFTPFMCFMVESQAIILF